MSNKAPSFFKLATQPKWIGALFLALIVAAIFGALGQWQLDRTFTKDDPKTNTSNSSLPMVTKQLYLDTKNTFIIDGRVQNGTTGYWLLMNATDENQVSTTLALGWVEKLEAAEQLRTNLMGMIQAEAFLDIAGYPLPTEGPQPADSAKPYLLKSVALGQLINLYSPDAPIKSSAEYLAVSAGSVMFSDGSLEPDVAARHVADDIVGEMPTDPAVEKVADADHLVFAVSAGGIGAGIVSAELARCR